MVSFEDLLPALLTNKEYQLFEKRFRIIQLLKTKLTYREIAKKMGISTTTVVRLNKRLRIRKGRKSKLEKPKKEKQADDKKLPWVIG